MNCLFEKILAQCVVPENIHTPTTEGIGNSEEVEGSKTQEIPEGRGRGVKRSIWFPDALQFNTDSKILSYLLSRSFTYKIVA